MRPPVEELAKLFERRTGCKTFRDYGGSGTVLLQIQQSKEGDIYICHDPFAYTCDARGISEKWHTIAYLQPALAVQAGNPKNVKGLKDLLRSDLKPGLPHRKYSTRGVILWEIFKKAGMVDAMKARNCFESRTHDLVNQLKLGSVDVAVLWDAPVKTMPEFEVIPIEDEYKVDAITSATSGRKHDVRRLKVNVVRLNLSTEPLLAAQFAKLCLSSMGREILEKHCFVVPDKE
jgi:molybdate transport system substrate-binding protein